MQDPQTTGRFPNLRKLSLALLEHIVEPIIGEKAIDEIKAPVREKELRDALALALQNTERRFLAECSDTTIRDAVLSLSLADTPSVVTAIREFYNRPNDPSLGQALCTQLSNNFSSLGQERIESGVSLYLGNLRRELVNIAPEIREKLQTQAILRLADTAERIEGQLATQTTPSRKEDVRDIVDSIVYAEYVLKSFSEWIERYSPLFAEQHDLDFFALATSSSSTSEQLSVLQLPDEVPVVILLGESGAGKTTALWRLCAEMANRLRNEEPSRLPVLVGLHKWNPEFTIRNLVQNQFSTIRASFDAVEESLLAGNCLILVDGLNELPQADDQRDAARRDLQNFFDKYPQNGYVFTCRTPDYNANFLEYQEDQDKKKIPAFEIQRLDRSQVEDYVHRNFADNLERAEGLLSKLGVRNERLWQEESSLVHLTRIPFYLQIVISEYQRTGEIPPNKAMLLHSFISNLVRKDEAKKTARIGLDGKIRLLGNLAYRGVKAGYYLYLPESTAKTYVSETFKQLLDEGVIARDISAGDAWQEILSNSFLILRRTSENYSYSVRLLDWIHQLIFDYFLACEMVRTLIVPETDETTAMQHSMRGSLTVWDQPCQIAFGLLVYTLFCKFILPT